MAAADVSLSRLGVVVVTYRSRATIESCLRGLPTAELAAVVVVDNGSDDETASFVRGLALPNVRVVEQDNVGFAGGCNRGLAELPATADLVQFLNPDATIAATSLRALVRYLDTNPRCALVGPRILRDGRPWYSAGRLPRLATELKPLFPRALGRPFPARRHEPDDDVHGPVGYVEGAAPLGRVEPLRALGGFDETYFLGYEEIDLARRLRDAGWTVDLCPDAVAEHPGGASRAQTAGHSMVHFVRSQVLYLRTWSGPAAAHVFTAGARLSWALRARTGRLEPELYEQMRRGLSTPIRRGQASRA